MAFALCCLGIYMLYQRHLSNIAWAYRFDGWTAHSKAALFKHLTLGRQDGDRALVRWETRVRPRILVDGAYDGIDEIRLHLGALADNGVPLVFEEEAPGDLTIIVTDDLYGESDPAVRRELYGLAGTGEKDVRRLLSKVKADRAQCYFLASYYDPRGPLQVGLAPWGMRGGVVVIRKSLTGFARTYCLMRQLTQVMGLFENAPADLPVVTSFDGQGRLAGMTPLDWSMLRLLYDRRLRAGMDAAELDALLPGILSAP
ncbi:MAG TPA: DUF2927 domain-containing protein [Azospirillaceae bacterium]|nr:DUF2927 domain-containing protein [Azospirillaceae bacterium]